MDFNHLPFMQHYKNGVKKITKPKGFDKMVELAKNYQEVFHMYEWTFMTLMVKFILES